MAKKQVGVSLRKPPPPADLDAFVSERQSEIRDLAPTKPAEIVVATETGRELRELTVYLTVDLARKLSLACVEKDRDMSNVIAEAVDGHLAPKPVPQPAPASSRRAARPRSWSEWGQAMTSLFRTRLWASS